jgi:hypothetical protein
MAVHDMLMAAGGSSAGAVNWVDDVFSTYLYTGNGSTKTITNGIDLSTKGGLVWIKNRTDGSYNHVLVDTARGVNKFISSDTALAQNASICVTSFNTDGFAINASDGYVNPPNTNEVSWTFRKQPKFFDIVTYTGDGTTSNRRISHNLGSAPGCIMVKRLNSTSDWIVYHKDLPATTTNRFLLLNSTAAYDTSSGIWGTAAPTSTDFGVGASSAKQNQIGATYVAYLFAHNAGGFGTAGTDNVISCGSFTTNSSGVATVNLGYEPQWLLIKRTDAAQNWYMQDNMRGLTVDGTTKNLIPNLSNAESSINVFVNSTGFSTNPLATSATYIYIAIRRPMKPPTTGTEVFSPNAYNASGTVDVTTGFPVDMNISAKRAMDGSAYFRAIDRLRGTSQTYNNALIPDASFAEINTAGYGFGFDNNTKYVDNFYGPYIGGANPATISWNFKRAPGFFDEVCYTGTGSTRTVTHNLGVAPEMMLVKQRTGTATENWAVYHSALGATKYLVLNGTGQAGTSSFWWNDTAPTSSVFTVADADATNQSAGTYVSYLFATCAGVSKVGSYTGTGTTNQINCGFTGGARFVMIKRTDSTGNWYVWDSARGIVSGNDPYLLLNGVDLPETTSGDYIDPYSAGFEISSTAPAAINASGGTFIYLAIA